MSETATRLKSSVPFLKSQQHVAISIAEERVFSALNHLRQAAVDLSEIAIDECQGHCKFKPVAIQDAMVDILNVKRLLESSNK